MRRVFLLCVLMGCGDDAVQVPFDAHIIEEPPCFGLGSRFYDPYCGCLPRNFECPVRCPNTPTDQWCPMLAGSSCCLCSYNIGFGGWHWSDIQVDCLPPPDGGSDAP